MKAISLFSGINGLCNAFETIYVNDICPNAEKLAKANNLDKIAVRSRSPIKECAWLADYVSESDIILASPPCQQFSTLNPKGRGHQADDLFTETFKIIAKSGKPAVIENTPNVVNKYRKDTIELCQSILPNSFVKFSVINLADLGLPQNRKRVFIFIDCDLKSTTERRSKDLYKHSFSSYKRLPIDDLKLSPRTVFGRLPEILGLDSPLPTITTKHPNWDTGDMVRLSHYAYAQQFSPKINWDVVPQLQAKMRLLGNAVPQTFSRWLYQNIDV
jgi:site-specific DNA-cytosine methylase